MKREKHIAVLISIVFHIIVFCVLAVCGVFAYLQHREEPQPIDVTVYDDEALQETPSAAAGGGGHSEADGSSDGGAADVINIPKNTELPKIDESSVTEEREVRKVMTETHVDVSAAKEIVSKNTGNKTANNGTVGNGSGDIAGGSGIAAEGTGAGPGNGGGTGGGVGGGTGSEQGKEAGTRPEQPATLLYQPDANSYYPEDLRRRNISAVVYVNVSISSDGTVVGAYVYNSSGYASMDAAAIQVAYLCRYDPARDSYGQPVSTNKRLKVPFNLR